MTGAAPVVDTTSASIATPFTAMEMSQLPSPGGDISNIAQTAPGAVLNNQGGYGNFTINGLPGTSNLFTVNGENDMDPYFNINNTGATNLTIGSGEIQEATVIANAYSGEYGQLSGAQVTYVTKSGTNQFHGALQYWWNGRTMNANDWMNNNSGAPRPFSNANQWMGQIGGPIIKNKTFFFFDTEGLRFVLPNVINTTIPTPAFAAATLANVQALQPAEAPLYAQMFKLFAGAHGAGGAQAIPNNAACNNINLPGFDPTTQACAAAFQAAPTALGSEWILAFKIDQNIGQNDKLFGRYKQDRGVQPTYLDPISPAFDALSNQPSWDVQVQETHIFSPNSTNEFTGSGSHYVAQFTQQQPLAFNTFPARLSFSGNVPFTSFNPMSSFPQGRNITQYQFIDNYTWNHGKHSFKFGGNFRRYDVSDHNFFYNYPRVFFGAGSSIPGGTLQGFSEGLAGRYRQSDNQASNVPIALWGLGVYAQDEWKVKQNLTLTLAMRVEYNSNPVCQINCFANYKTSWNNLPSVQAGDNAGQHSVHLRHRLQPAQGLPGRGRHGLVAAHRLQLVALQQWQDRDQRRLRPVLRQPGGRRSGQPAGQSSGGGPAQRATDERRHPGLRSRTEWFACHLPGFRQRLQHRLYVRADLFPDRRGVGRTGSALLASQLHRHHRHLPCSALAGVEHTIPTTVEQLHRVGGQLRRQPRYSHSLHEFLVQRRQSGLLPGGLAA